MFIKRLPRHVFKRMWAVLMFAAAFHCSDASASDTGARQSAKHWSALARIDVEAAHRLINQNHPGAARSLEDPDFKRRLRDGYAQARSRAAQVDSFAGYAATLKGFANSFGDEHVWANALVGPFRYRWAGLLVSRSATGWTVRDTSADHKALLRAELLQCDGTSAEELGRERLGSFRADWSVPAQRIKQAPWLLIDDGNPFLPVLKSCELRTTTGTTTVRLNWRDVARTDLLDKISRAVATGKAGYGVRKFVAGTWIALEGLEDKTPAVIADVRSQLDQIRRSRLIVIDVRGNGGGASEYGDQLARLLLGDAYVTSILSASPEASCSDVWRASPGNIETIRNYRSSLGPTLGPEFVRQMDELLIASKKALARGAEFSGPSKCGTKVASAAAHPFWPARFKLILLTDPACFSSCLLMTGEFRLLGALHIGQATDAATRYMEVREELLRSRLTKFSTLQSVALGVAPRVGPFVPSVAYSGDIADTPALERWIAASF